MSNPAIARLQSVLPFRDPDPTPLPDASATKIVLVHYDVQDDPVYWCGWTNGHDGQGWTAERSEALEFPSFATANIERNRAKQKHHGMQIKLDGGE